ncbi:unnamed protein product [Phytophthora lilii]|uniref:Unnamed protein product n=1 Tax=Phytophthora lilii TaxID=2077276 RepID=A0A9W7CKQ4_9STRA|nr:unnamed protein product [Phytophthora lilii]
MRCRSTNVRSAGLGSLKISTQVLIISQLAAGSIQPTSLTHSSNHVFIFLRRCLAAQFSFCIVMVKRFVYPAFVVMVPLLIALVFNALLTPDQPAEVMPQHLKLTGDHAYFRPLENQVSGFKDSAAKYHRSPCPALNALANHGYLPRDGKGVTPQHLQQALVSVYNLHKSLAEFLVSSLPEKFTLADLGEHNFVEHDASLVHEDSFKGTDPCKVNVTMVCDLLSRADKNAHLTRSTFAAYRRERELDSAANTPDFKDTFNAQRALTAYSEPAVLLLVLGDDTTTSISIDDARSFLREERIPDDYEMPKVPVTLYQSLWLTLQLKILALMSGFM